jgi:TolB-like protein/DNA-binding winged helix-turn-helix (wHTH) protein/Tfp pilus assembly protein PilF
LLNGDVQVPLTSKAFDTLLTLIEHGGEVLEKDFLLNTIWPDTTVEEKNLTIAVSAVRKALGETPSQHEFIVTVPGRGYKFVAGVRDLTSEDQDFVVEKHTSQQITIEEIEATEPLSELIARSGTQPLLPSAAPSRRHRFRVLKMILAITVVLAVLAVFYFGFYRGSHPLPQPKSRIGSLAVLPFKSWDARDEDEYLGLGITDALITRLSNINEVIVRPTEAVRKYYRVEQDALSAGQELRVDSVLQGNIQRASDRIRVTVQLVRVIDGKPIWGETFDEKADNLFLLEDSISRRVVSGLTLTLTTRESERLAKRYTENTQAYQLYLKGRYYSSNWTLDGFHKAIGYFNDAIALDPNYALAYAGLADTYYRNATVHIPLGEAVPKARNAVMQALRLDDTLAEAHTSLAMIKFRYDWDWTGAETEFKRAIDLNQNYATAHQWYSEYFTALDRTEEAVAEASRAEQIDPISPEVGWDLGLALFFGRRYDQAIEQFKRTIDLNPNFWLPHSFLAWCYGEKGEFDKAFAEYDKALALDDNEDTLSQMASIDVKAGRRTEARKILDELMRRQQRKEVSPLFISAVYFALDDKEQGFKWLEKAYREKAELLVFLKVAPNFQGVRSDPRYKKIMADVGL